MRLRDFGDNPDRTWFQQIMEWSRKKVTFDDNIDCVFITADVGTSNTEVGHSLGRTPKYILEVASYPYGTAGITFTKAPTADKLFISRTSAGKCVLLLM